MSRLFLPTARQICILLAVGALSLGCALYLRYLVIEQSSVGLACDAGLETWLCRVRAGATGLFRHSVFGIVALAAAVINLIRPSVMLFGLGLAAGGFGIVLYNVGLSALAIALLMLSLARHAPATDSARGP
jgi:hypothetical protein